MEFCTAVAVVVTGVTVIYMANNARGKTTSARSLGSNWWPYFNVAETLRSDCSVIL